MIKLFRIREEQKGFTLIELMIVIAIIGILAAIAIPQFVTYRQKAYNSEAKAELKGFYTACQAYFSDHPPNDCSVSMVSSLFVPQSPRVQVTVPAGSGTSMIGTTAQHEAGTVTYTIGNSGNITP
jgi:prepilin-type N-terminal cleavage/methylation domain-containing protein